ESELPGRIPTFGDYHKVFKVYLLETDLLATCSRFFPVRCQVEPLVVHAQLKQIFPGVGGAEELDPYPSSHLV
ncbi:hypothetical protein O181_121305, partial [Austropuccinia psidii MF-1]|nr:hypothetical protein [Austropuccinia psidii MF-1]